MCTCSLMEEKTKPNQRNRFTVSKICIQRAPYYLVLRRYAEDKSFEQGAVLKMFTSSTLSHKNTVIVNETLLKVVERRGRDEFQSLFASISIVTFN